MCWGEREMVFGLGCVSGQINSDFFTLVKLVRTKRKNTCVCFPQSKEKLMAVIWSGRRSTLLHFEALKFDSMILVCPTHDIL